jgi:hypothetical protein
MLAQLIANCGERQHSGCAVPGVNALGRWAGSEVKFHGLAKKFFAPRRGNGLNLPQFWLDFPVYSLLCSQPFHCLFISSLL